MTREQWQEEFDSGRVRDVDYETMSGLPLDPLYAPADADVSETVGWPGQYPYTRGVHPSGYRGRLWTMRMFAGFGTPESTNQRFKEILAAGGGGLSTAAPPPQSGRRRDKLQHLAVGDARAQRELCFSSRFRPG